MAEFELKYKTYTPVCKRPDGFFYIAQGRTMESARRSAERLLDMLKNYGFVARYSFNRAETRELPGIRPEDVQYMMSH